jgi:hypothetical protein
MRLDDALDAIGHAERRRLLLALSEHTPRDDSPPGGSTDRDTGDAAERIRMHHVHLPKLDDYGFVDWNERAGEVRRGSEFDRIEPLLELFDEHGSELPFDWP